MKLEEKIRCLLLDQILAAAFWHGEHAFCMRWVWRPLRKQLSRESNANRNRRDLSVRWPLALREGNPRSPMFPFGWSKDWQGRCPASSNRFMVCSRSPSHLPLSKWAGKSSSFHSLCREPRGEAALYFCQASVEPVKRWTIIGGPERFLSLLDLGGLKYSYGQALNCSVYTKLNWAQLIPSSQYEQSVRQKVPWQLGIMTSGCCNELWVECVTHCCTHTAVEVTSLPP